LDPAWPPLWLEMYEYDRRQVWGDFPRSVERAGWEARSTPIIDAVRRLLPAGARVLDAASSQGNFALALADLGYEVTWNDLREELIGYVRLKDPDGRLSYLPGDLFELSRRHGGEFDAVVATEIIEHVAHPDEMLRTLRVLVRPGGYLFMSTPNGRYIRDRHPRFSDCEDASVFESVQFQPDAEGHIFFLHYDEIVTLAAAADLELIEYLVTGNPLTWGHMKLARPLAHLPHGLVTFVEALTRRLPLRVRMLLHRHSIFVLRRPL
jgi:2-polyprenyl-6-hydroxyphenyl methylase/3-demethylubiquinone-9 3-methyltransferase